ncbi:hypothetical protein VTN49DRAFT_7657 [Thermomyces lanuginosus]|uniref:uncharacterized protein n=1 Tax=Thermomyces lanuginosus TaxID=5541 RepID=UPI003742E322
MASLPKDLVSTYKPNIKPSKKSLTKCKALLKTPIFQCQVVSHVEFLLGRSSIPQTGPSGNKSRRELYYISALSC